MGALAKFDLPAVIDFAPVTPSAVSTGAPVPRRRFQRGSLVKKSGRWYGVYRADVIQGDGTFKREQCWQPLGQVDEQSKRAAWCQFQPYLDKVNEAAKRLPQKSGLTLSDYVQEWRRDVAVNLKGSTARAAESHLRAHIIPKLGSLHLTQITTKAVQGFVAHLSGGERSRKTVENVLLTLSSLLKTARAWGYACGDFRFADLTLPREGVQQEQRYFSDDEVRKIIAAAREPLRTIVAITSKLALRIGETLALRVSDVDFANRIIRIRQSVDAATRVVGGVKSKASSADKSMDDELESLLRSHLLQHNSESELLFVNRRERPFSANKLRAKQLHPLLDKLGIARGGFHAFRHGAVSEVASREPMPVVQKFARHSDPRITLGTYSHVLGDAERKLVSSRRLLN
jgi:integrase